MGHKVATAGSRTLRLSNHCSVNTSKHHILEGRLSVDKVDSSIHTDYESVFPQGIHREYWLNVTDKVISPDGYLKTEGKVLNGSYPGPLIEACWGDDITVHVTNYVKTNGSTIHWHGLRQFHTNEADGVNGVTQCPIAFGDTFDYNFKALQYGHTWYHSHYSLQYPDGVAGPLLIHGPWRQLGRSLGPNTYQRLESQKCFPGLFTSSLAMLLAVSSDENPRCSQ